VRIYYEDTDLSGVVYHANYLKYFERAREHLLGPDELVRLFQDEGVGFVVYKCELYFRAGAKLGDVLTIRSHATTGSRFRAVFKQAAWRDDLSHPLVEATIQLACVNGSGSLVPIPTTVAERIAAITESTP